MTGVEQLGRVAVDSRWSERPLWNPKTTVEVWSPPPTGERAPQAADHEPFGGRMPRAHWHLLREDLHTAGSGPQRRPVAGEAQQGLMPINSLILENGDSAKKIVPRLQDRLGGIVLL